MEQQSEKEITIRIGNTLIRISDEYAVKTPEDTDRILERIKIRAQQELSK